MATLEMIVSDALNATIGSTEHEDQVRHICDELLAAGFRRLDPLTATDPDSENDRFAIMVRSVYGPYREQVVSASSITEALRKAESIPLTEWVGDE